MKQHQTLTHPDPKPPSNTKHGFQLLWVHRILVEQDMNDSQLEPTTILWHSSVHEVDTVKGSTVTIYVAQVRVRYQYPVPVLVRGTTFLEKLGYGYVCKYIFNIII
jgi:hypothetical protein